MTNIIKKELTEDENNILLLINTNSITSAKEISEILDLSESYVISILNNEDFYNLICANSLSNMRLAYHSKAIPRLIERLDNEHNFIDSYDRLTKAIGAVNTRDNESLKVSLEVLLKEAKVEKHISSHINNNKENLNTVYETTKTSGNIFAIEDNRQESHKSKEIVFEFEDEE